MSIFSTKEARLFRLLEKNMVDLLLYHLTRKKQCDIFSIPEFGSLMELEGGFFISLPSEIIEIGIIEFAGCRKPVFKVFLGHGQCVGGGLGPGRSKLAVIGLIEGDPVLHHVGKEETPLGQVAVHLLQRVDDEADRVPHALED